ncbi:MAG: hypothetical protein AAFN92_21120, partial [Bacteroidota bacterium]
MELNNRWGFPLILGFTLLLFLVKGVRFAVIGRSLPLALGLFIMLLVGWSLTRSSKTQRIVIRCWAGLLVGWTLLRLGLTIAVRATNSITENHVYEHTDWQSSLFVLAL